MKTFTRLFITSLLFAGILLLRCVLFRVFVTVLFGVLAVAGRLADALFAAGVLFTLGR